MSKQDSPVDRQRNLKLALILASVAVTFLAGFVAKMVMFSHH